ncbi:MAG: hypothetical protein ACOCXO_01905 [Bacteroidota bacterium]
MSKSNILYFQQRYHRGIRNKYRKGMPVFEMLTKDIGHLFLSLRHCIANGFRNRRIFVYPHYPSRGSTIYKIAKILHYNISNRRPEKAGLCVYWEYLTLRKEYHLPGQLSADMPVVNLQSRDISKNHVDEIFFDVFAYGTFIDPLEYEGFCVRKSDQNATHDGLVLHCPIKSPEEGYIYQRLIDNSIGEDAVEDIRVPVVRGCLDFVYLKRRYKSERFLNTTYNTEVKNINDVLSGEEVSKLNAFCLESGLDFGELDVLRDNEDGRIYVVDVNNTPQGPPANTARKEAKLALQKIAKAFAERFINQE